MSEDQFLIWDILQKHDERFTTIFAIPTLKQFLDSIEKTTIKETTLAFIKFFKITIDLEWNKTEKTFQYDGGSHLAFPTQILLTYFDINFSLDIYFDKGYFFKENIESYYINPSAYEPLYNRILKSSTLQKRYDRITETQGMIFEINLHQFISNDENYHLLENIGMVKYILEIVRKVKELYISLS